MKNSTKRAGKNERKSPVVGRQSARIANRRASSTVGHRSVSPSEFVEVLENRVRRSISVARIGNHRRASTAFLREDYLPYDIDDSQGNFGRREISAARIGNCRRVSEYRFQYSPSPSPTRYHRSRRDDFERRHLPDERD